MSVIWVLILLFLVPGILFLAWLALSSCLGNSLRARISARDIESTARNEDLEEVEDDRPEFDKHYFRAMAQGGVALDEFIEMRNLIEDPPGEEYD